MNDHPDSECFFRFVNGSWQPSTNAVDEVCFGDWLEDS